MRIKSLLITLIVFNLISCNNTFIEQVCIRNTRIKTKINDKSEDIRVYHVYFENINDKEKSCGFNIFDLSDDNGISLFPGVYNVYGYGLSEKTASTMMVSSYAMLENYEIFSGTLINLYFLSLYPCYNLTSAEEILNLSIQMGKISGIFYLSSLSVKQGSDRVRSLHFSYNKDLQEYESVIPLYANGDWYMNLSFGIKSKVDEEMLEADDISITTNYFGNIYLGNFNLIE